MKHLFTSLLLLCATAVTAHDFVVDGIYYNISSSANKAVEVTCKGPDCYYYSNEYTGNVVIPESVTYNGATYSVTSIGEDAFYDCDGLTSIEIPNSVTSIGSSAFEDCSGLEKVCINDLEAWCGIDFGSADANPLYYAGNLYLNGELVTDLTIPSSVTSIGYGAFYNCKGLTSITIPNSVTSIGNYAFSGCTGLTSVEIGNSVKSIGECAFKDCSGLTSIEIPNSVTSIGDWTFYECTGLTSITIPNSVTSIGKSAFSGCKGLKTVINFSNLTFSKSSSSNGYVAYYADKVYNLPNGSKEGDFIFGKPNDVNTLVVYLGNATELTLPANCEGENYVIDSEVFKNNTTITSIAIPNSVTNIGSSAFSGCINLKKVELNTTTVENWFSGNASINEVVIGNSVTSIGNSAFNDCTGLTSVEFNAENCTSMGDRYDPVFRNCTALSTVTIGENVKNIPAYAFSGCTGLTSVVIPNSVTNIGSSAFSGCINLKKVELNTTTVENWFSGNASINEVVIGNSVTRVGDSAFNGCTGLTSVEFNAGNCTSMGSYNYPVFSGCTALSTVTIGENVKNIPAKAFLGCTGLTSVVIPNSVTSIGVGAFEDCSGITSVEFNAENCTSMGSYNYPVFSGCTALSTVTIGENVKNIPAYAFTGCTGLASVVIPNSVTSVGNDAFTGCNNIEKLDLNCAEIGDWFSGVSALKEVTIGDGVTTVVASAFNGCSGLEKVCISDIAIWCGIDFADEYANPLYYANNLYLNGELLTDISIPAEIEEVKDYAFYNCKGVTNINIVDGVKSIGNNAFYGCSDLETLYISNTIESIDDYAFAECNNIFDIKIGSKKAITASENIFSIDAYNNVCLYVPTGRNFAYKKTAPWSNFYIVEMDFTGIDEVKAENGTNGRRPEGLKAKVKTVYDLQGRKVENPTNGVYIINGKKVVIK